MEVSTAAQCPSVAYQLAGAKKVQQDLASPEVLERFLDSKEEVELARSCFAGKESCMHACILVITNKEKDEEQGLVALLALLES